MPRTIHSKIAGVTMTNDDGASRQDLIRKLLDDGDMLVLQREPENPYGSTAIAIYYDGMLDDFVKLGYIKSDLAAKLAPVMDAGCAVIAEVAEVTGRDEDILGVNIGLTVLTLEETKAQNARLAAKPSQAKPPAPAPRKQVIEHVHKVIFVEKTDKNFWVLLTYYILLGPFGGHRWYAGRGSWGYTLTLGWFLIG